MRILILLLALFCAPSALAAVCTFQSGSASVLATMALPATLSVPRNVTNGTALWDSGWKAYSGTTINCSAAGTVKGGNATGIGAAEPGYTSNGFASVFKTNVPGVGVSVFWCNQPTADCNPDPSKVTPVPSLAWNVSAVQYPLNTNWRVRLIKTADIDASAGAVSVPGLSYISYADLGVTTLMLTGTSQISGLGCEVNADSRNIDVPLPTIAKTDFVDSPIPRANDKAKTFKINLLCDSGVKVSYQVDGAQTTGDGNVLANASGTGMATGVGVTLFIGDLSSVTRLPLASRFLHTTTSSGNLPVSIPLTARYYRTAATPAAMGAGLVSTTATFTLFYE
ncbi:fimbrial protein [Pseudomonas nitroreducens]|uniref:fimbrial protein n=1 Tax=Pseudomonas nitroreducens TaxID=46680 RepID=UPI002657C773|nr:fimbrial protein [Pseudomonas nitroreducens]MCP1649076.1 type 1 fimbria pilin [Pseudomonas nitroreducens]MCP1684963.1 type 1 fimbria pilin [Pseudomonas nitroreducens]